MIPVSFNEANENSKTYDGLQFKMYCHEHSINPSGVKLKGLSCIIKYQPSKEDIEAIVSGSGIYVITFTENALASETSVPCIDVTTENPFEQSE